MGRLLIPKTKDYLYIASGTGLSPDINKLKFYDSGLTSQGAPIYYAEDLSYKLQRDNVFSNFYSWQLWKFNYPTDQSNRWYTNLIQNLLTPDLEYPNAANGAVGTVTISQYKNKISVKKTNTGSGKISLYKKFAPNALQGLALWLKADAGVSKFSYNYISEIVITGTSNPSFAGTYTANGVPTYNFEDGIVDIYSFTGPAGKSMVWSADDGYFMLSSSGESSESFISYDGINWTPINSYIYQIVITGFIGDYVGANGTYNTDGDIRFDQTTGLFYIQGNGLYNSSDDSLIATNNSGYQGAWTPATFINQVTISGAGTSSVNGVYTRASSGLDGKGSFSGPASLTWEESDDAWYLGSEAYLAVGVYNLTNWVFFNTGLPNAPTGVTTTAPRPVGSPTSTSSSKPSGSISGSVTTSTVNTENVTGWADQSGNGKNATATDTPTLSTVDGKTFIDFAGGYFTGNELITAPYVTIMCVARHSDYQEIGVMFQQFSEADNLAFYRGYSNINNFRIYNGVDLDSSSETNSNETYLFGTTVNNDTGTLYLNGSQDANGLCGELTPAGTYYLGRWVGGGLTTTVLKMAEIVVYDRVLTTPERQKVEAYLNEKYAIY